MGLGEKVRSVVGKPRVLDGGMLIVFLLLATGVIWGLLFGSSQVAQPLPLLRSAKEIIGLWRNMLRN